MDIENKMIFEEQPNVWFILRLNFVFIPGMGHLWHKVNKQTPPLYSIWLR